MRNDPFCVFGLPRSRTAWLAQFLSYGGRECRHEGTVPMRSFDAVLATLRAGVGLSDTMLGLRAHEIADALPAVRLLIVLRDVNEVRASMEKIGFPMPGPFLDTLSETLYRLHPLSNTRYVGFDDLSDREMAGSAFQHCLGETMPDDWFDLWKDVNVQTSPKSVMQAAADNYTGVRSIYGRWL